MGEESKCESPAPPFVYFEVHVLDGTATSELSATTGLRVGVVSQLLTESDADLDARVSGAVQLGTFPGSCCLGHSGKVMWCSPTAHASTTTTMPPLAVGLVLGCGINTDTGTVFFTSNARLLATVRCVNPASPFRVVWALGFQRHAVQLRTNFGTAPFSVDNATLTSWAALPPGCDVSSSPPPLPTASPTPVVAGGSVSGRSEGGSSARGIPAHLAQPDGLATRLLAASGTTPAAPADGERSLANNIQVMRNHLQFLADLITQATAAQAEYAAFQSQLGSTTSQQQQQQEQQQQQGMGGVGSGFSSTGITPAPSLAQSNSGGSVVVAESGSRALGRTQLERRAGAREHRRALRQQAQLLTDMTATCKQLEQQLVRLIRTSENPEDIDQLLTLFDEFQSVLRAADTTRHATRARAMSSMSGGRLSDDGTLLEALAAAATPPTQPPAGSRSASVSWRRGPSTASELWNSIVAQQQQVQHQAMPSGIASSFPAPPGAAVFGSATSGQALARELGNETVQSLICVVRSGTPRECRNAAVYLGCLAESPSANAEVGGAASMHGRVLVGCLVGWLVGWLLACSLARLLVCFLLVCCRTCVLVRSVRRLNACAALCWV